MREKKRRNENRRGDEEKEKKETKLKKEERDKKIKEGKKKRRVRSNVLINNECDWAFTFATDTNKNEYMKPFQGRVG